MKKVWSVLIFILCFIFLTMNVFAEPISLSYDGKVVEYNGKVLSLKINGEDVQSSVAPIVLNDRTMVPARAVFEKIGASVDWSAEQQKVYVALNNYKVELKLDDTTALVNGSPVTMDVPAKLINERTMIPARFVAEQLNMKVGWEQNSNLVSIDNSQIKDISVEPTASGSVVKINLDFFQNYKVFTLKNPDRIVIDFPNVNTSTSQKTIDINSGAVRDVRYAKFKDATGYSAARVVLDVDSSITYTVEKSDNTLLVYLTGQISTTPTPSPSPTPSQTTGTTPSPSASPAPSSTPINIPVFTPKAPVYYANKPVVSFNNVTYNISGDRVYFKLTNGDLAGVPYEEIKKYTDAYENDGKKYIMTYKKELANLGEGVMKINDGLIDTVEFIKDDGNGNSKIIFNCKTKLIFKTFQRFNYGNNGYIDTVIDVLKPYTAADKLVVIDPGHGGLETGATSGGLAEQHLNLDISLRVYKLLKEKGVNVFLIRNDDTYVDLYERAILANTMNASLFVSIHNNSFNGSAYGTETLYYNNSPKTGFTSYDLATILQRNLISNLYSYNRGLKERPGLVVLNRTLMPAALVEVGFVDNEGERNYLMKEDFRQSAAKGICDGIIEGLSKK